MSKTNTLGPATNTGFADGAVSNEFDHAVGHSREGARGLVSKLTMAHGGHLGGSAAPEQVANVGSGHSDGMGGSSNSGLSNPPTAAANHWPGAATGHSPMPKNVNKGF